MSVLERLYKFTFSKKLIVWTNIDIWASFINQVNLFLDFFMVETKSCCCPKVYVGIKICSAIFGNLWNKMEKLAFDFLFKSGTKIPK